MKKKINKRALTLGILTAITISLFASVLVVYGKDRDLKAERLEATEKAFSQVSILSDVNKEMQKAIPAVKTVDVMNEVAAELEEKEAEDTEEENNEVESEEENAFYGDDYTGTMAAEYNLGTGIYGFSSRDAYVLACVVSAEVGDQDYDCQLAVANVVIHRGLNLGGCPGAIEEAVYQPNQFEVAYNSMQGFLAYGPQADAIRASQDALNGIDNVPGYEHFCYYTIMDGYMDCDGGIMIGSEWFYY